MIDCSQFSQILGIKQLVLLEIISIFYVAEKNASNSSKIIKESEDHEHHHKDRNMEDTTYKDALKKMEGIISKGIYETKSFYKDNVNIIFTR